MSAEYNVEVDRVTKADWSNLLHEFSDAAIYQTWSYGATRWGERNLSHLILAKAGRPVGLAQVTIRTAPVLRAGIGYIPWGPLWRHRGEQPDLSTFPHLIHALKEEYAGRRRLQLRIAPKEIDAGSASLREFLVNEGFRRSGKAYRTLLLDLEPSLQDLRKGFDQKWRNQLNRAEKNGLEIVEGMSDELYDTFAKLYKEMLARKGFETFVDVGEFGRIQADLERASKMVVMLCIAHNEPVAGLVGSALGDTGIYLLGATNDAGMKIKGSYLLQWRFIEWLKECGCRWYDLGGIDPEGNPGVYHFKSGVSDREVSHIGEFDFVESRISSAAVKIGSYLRDRRNRAGT
jgi:hypothetical protein